MPLTQEQISAFTQKAKSLGATDQQILVEINRKQQEVAALDEARSALGAGIITPEDAFNSGVSVADIQASGVKSPLSKEQQKQQMVAQEAGKLFSNLRSLYEGDKGGSDDLSVGILPRVGLYLQQLTRSGKDSTVSVDGKKKTLSKGERANLYKKNIDAFTSQLKSLSGESGVLSDQDRKDLKKAFPKFTDSPEEAATQWGILQSMIDNKLSAIGVNPSTINSVTQQVNDMAQQQTDTSQDGGIKVGRFTVVME